MEQIQSPSLESILSATKLRIFHEKQTKYLDKGILLSSEPGHAWISRTQASGLKVYEYGLISLSERYDNLLISLMLCW